MLRSVVLIGGLGSLCWVLQSVNFPATVILVPCVGTASPFIAVHVQGCGKGTWAF